MPVVGELGWAWWSNPDPTAPSQEIILDPRVCQGLVYLQAPWPLRRMMEVRAYGAANWHYWAGVAALTILHEATHIAGNHDETSTECTAMALLPEFLASYLSDQPYDDALAAATRYDSYLPADYHQYACGT